MANEIDKAIEEAAEANDKFRKGEENNLHEAPASANIVCWIDGFRTQLTMRDAEVSKVMDKLEFVVDYIKKKGWKPSWKEEPEKEPEPEGEVPKCEKCGSDMVKRKGKTGWFWGCSGFPDCKGTRQIE